MQDWSSFIPLLLSCSSGQNFPLLRVSLMLDWAALRSSGGPAWGVNRATTLLAHWCKTGALTGRTSSPWAAVNTQG